MSTPAGKKDDIPPRVPVLTRLHKFGWFKLIGLMLALGVALAWISSYWIPDLVRWGVPHAMANRLPLAALACGVAWALAVALFEEPKLVLEGIAMMLVIGVMFSIGGLFAGGVLIAVGMPEKWADKMPGAAFYLGIITGALLVLLMFAEEYNLPRVANALAKALVVPFGLVVIAFVVFEFFAGALVALAFIDVIIAIAVIVAIVGGAIWAISMIANFIDSRRQAKR